jgi:hypothetical protein
MNPGKSLAKAFKVKRRLFKRKLHTFPLWYKEPGYIFIHINKTGGSSIEKALNLPFEHLTALEKINDVGLEKWQNKFSFAFVRNPFDKVYSHYRYRVKTNQTHLKNKPLTFSDWVKKSYGDKDPFYFDQPKMFMPQVNWLCDEKGQLLVDQVYRFETLNEDFDQLCQKFSLTKELPHLKASKKVNYQSFYDEESQQIIEQHFAQDLKLFNYRFDSE